MQYLKSFMILGLLVYGSQAIAMDDIKEKTAENVSNGNVLDTSVSIECKGAQIKVPNSGVTCSQVYLVYGALLKKNRENNKAKDELVENSIKNKKID